MDILISFASTKRQKFSGNGDESDVGMVLNALTLQCPNVNCLASLDPNSDGCSAIKCRSCSSHFCWLCFSLKNGSQVCHQHVLKCTENPTKQLFHAPEVIEKVHRKRKIESVRRALLNMTGSNWQHSERALAAVVAAEKVLRDSEISPDEVFADTVSREQQAYYLVINSFDSIGLTTLFYF